MLLELDAPRETNVTTSFASIDDLLSGSASAMLEYLALIGSNAGRPALAITIRMADAIGHTKVYNDPDHPEESAQRELNDGHANGLAIYVLHAAASSAVAEMQRLNRPVPPEYGEIVRQMGPQDVFVLAPWTANLRGVDRNDTTKIRFEPLAKLNGVNAVKVSLSSTASWSLLDGQHRRGGLERASTFLDYIVTTGSYPSGKGKRSFFGLKGPVPPQLKPFWNEVRSALGRMTVTLDLHIGLSVAEERQVFADLNNKTRKVATDLSYQYDRGNPIVVFIQDELADLVGSDDEGGMSLTELAGVNAIAFQNKTNVRGALSAVVDDRKSTIRSMWDAIREVDGFGDPDASVIAEPVVQKGIAKLLYDLAFAKNRTDADDEHLQTLLNDLNDVDFSNENPMWRYYTLPEAQRTGSMQPNALRRIEEYLPRDENNRVIRKDIGSYQDGRFSFSVKHNDVYPVIADMIRFKLGLPSRHA